MTITSIDHVQLAMPPGKEDEAIAYFSGLLKFAEQKKPQPLAERGGCWFTSGACHLHLGVEPDFRPQRKAHPAFLSTDLQALADRLARHGYAVTWDPAFPDRRRFYTEDPFGNRIECMQDGHGFTQR